MLHALTRLPSPPDSSPNCANSHNPGVVHRIVSDHTDPGGKGINVALGTTRAGIATRAILPANAADPLLTLLDEDGLAYVAV